MAEQKTSKFVPPIGDIEKKPPVDVKNLFRGCVVTMAVFFLLLIAAFVLYIWPISNSLSGQYVPPTDITQIEQYSRARWLLHDAQRKQLEASISWFGKIEGDPAASTVQLDLTGFRPFYFVDNEGNEIKVINKSNDEGSQDDQFLLIIHPELGEEGGIISRRTSLTGNMLGNIFPNINNKEYPVDLDYITRKHTQFMQDEATPHDYYTAYLSEVWESAVIGYTSVYQKRPDSFEQMKSALGFEVNENCVWPFEGNSIDASCEGGIIGTDYVYWKVYLSNGETYDRVWPWNYYFRDDESRQPGEVPGSGSQSIQRMEDVTGTIKILYTDRTIFNLLDSINTEIE